MCSVQNGMNATTGGSLEITPLKDDLCFVLGRAYLQQKDKTVQGQKLFDVYGPCQTPLNCWSRVRSDCATFWRVPEQVKGCERSNPNMGKTSSSMIWHGQPCKVLPYQDKQERGQGRCNGRACPSARPLTARWESAAAMTSLRRYTFPPIWGPAPTPLFRSPARDTCTLHSAFSIALSNPTTRGEPNLILFVYYFTDDSPLRVIFQSKYQKRHGWRKRTTVSSLDYSCTKFS